MRGHIFDKTAARQLTLRLVQSVNLFAFPSGIRPPHPRMKGWAISAVTRSGFKYRTGSCRGAWKLRPGNSIHLFAPGCRRQENNPENDGSLHTAWASFDADQDGPLRALCNKDGLAQFLDPQHLVIALINQCADVSEQQKDRGFPAAQSLLYQIIQYLLDAELIENHQFAIGPKARIKKTDKLAESVQDYLRRHLHELVRLEDIAAACHISVSTLSHRYREQCGESPLQTHNTMRMNQARQLLLLGESVGSVAEQLGYADIYHFSKAFKKFEGCAPRHFLKNIQS